jgi:tRNA(adenine34) deaminase
MNLLDKTMLIAIDEAKQSLREGNHGFGAVIIKGDEVIAQAHDEEETTHDPTSHAEINAIKIASSKIGKSLTGCIIVSTHEPCPMCASAIVWSGINEIAYGYSIVESLGQGRKRINLTCDEVFSRAGKDIEIHSGVLADKCRILYIETVRKEVKRLRNTTDEKLKEYNEESMERRVKWFRENKPSFDFLHGNPLESAYNLLLRRFGITSDEAPIIKLENNRVTFQSMNFCPTLEACKILNLDTRYICKLYNEKSTDRLIKQVDAKLRFERNYEKIRPHSEYCEEMIVRE